VFEASYSCGSLVRSAAVRAGAAAALFTCTAAKARAIVSYRVGEENMLWSVRKQIVGDHFRDRAVQWAHFANFMRDAPGDHKPVARAELTPGSVGFDLDGYVFRNAACGHGTNLMSLHEPDSLMWPRPCPLSQLVGPVQTSRGFALLWIHERWYEESEATRLHDREHWRNLHDWLQEKVRRSEKV
jgi:hypothetical protein